LAKKKQKTGDGSVTAEADRDGAGAREDDARSREDGGDPGDREVGPVEGVEAAAGDDASPVVASSGEPGDLAPAAGDDAEDSAPREKKKQKAKKVSLDKTATGPAADAAAETGPRSRAHLIRGGAIFATGILLTFLVMANSGQLFRGALVGMVTTLVAVIGLLDLLGLLSTDALRSSARELGPAVDWRATPLWHQPGEPLWCAPAITLPVAIVLFTVLALATGIHGMPVTVLATLAVLAVSALRRPAMMVFCVGSAIVLPFLGVYGLWDPWETHYGEVAREILARDDWISTWWAQEDWFWSKPIFIFWIESLSMSALGVGFQPDANPVSPEWAIRLPHYFLVIGALLSVYAMVQRAFGRRAGVLAALVLATTPHFFFLSHQAITDMPFVSTMTMAMSMLGLAVLERSDREVTRYRFGKVTFSAQHAMIAAIAMACLPQILMLATRNVSLVTGGFHWHADRFVFGSAGNAGNPGNAELREVDPAFTGIGAQPLTQGLIWLAGFALIVWMLKRERRAQALYMFAFYFFCALSFMAKGIPGFALPGMVAMFWLIASRRWDLMLEGRLRVAAGILVVATVGLPWYVAMYIRHAQGFTDRLLVHDHLNRLTAGVHGDTGSIEYFFEQLGYGLFPWIALAPLAIGAWVWIDTRRRGAPEPAPDVVAAYRETPEEREEPAPAIDPARTATSRREILMLVGLWGTSAFVLFSAMTTKFHHYIFPAVPACGILVGLALDRLFGSPSDLEAPTVRGVAGTIAAVIAPLPIVLGVAGMIGDVRGIVPEGVTGTAMRDWVIAHPWYPHHCFGLIALGVALLGAAWAMLRPSARTEPAADEGSPRWVPAAATAGLFAAPVIVALVGRDLSWVTSARPYGYERLIHLFVYNYGRQWPEHLDYRPILTGFAVVTSVMIGLAALPVIRQVALRAFLGAAIAFAVWSLDVYLIDLSPHWGQRELFHAYYEHRGGPDEPVIAWQMNWKGENFYTGNRVYAFVDLDNRRLQEWAREHPGQRVWFVLEHGRLSNLRTVLRGATIEAVTDERLDNKFVLVSADLPGTPRPTPAPPATLD
jgi:4-amino-4-deoxy-L-arabinose transferase-like glycosyltransferase